MISNCISGDGERLEGSDMEVKYSKKEFLQKGFR